MPADQPPLTIRPLGTGDSITALTQMLHRAYAPLAAQGLRYVATYQSDDVTRNRIAGGACFVAERHGAICGTILYKSVEKTKGCDWYDRPDVASFGQFGVDPALQSQGIGRMLLAAVVAAARADGAAELALDTAEPAADLIAWYHRLGFRDVGFAQWSMTNYRSLVMSMTL